MNSTRRDFIVNTALAGPALITPLSSKEESLRGKFIHHVFFWLKNPDKEEDRSKLLSGLKKLTAIKSIRMFQIGEPASTSREVIDRTYSVSWLLVFKNQAGQDKYQTDPIHLDFVKQCSPLWNRVVVYDSVEVVR